MNLHALLTCRRPLRRHVASARLPKSGVGGGRSRCPAWASTPAVLTIVARDLRGAKGATVIVPGLIGWLTCFIPPTPAAPPPPLPCAARPDRPHCAHLSARRHHPTDNVGTAGLHPPGGADPHAEGPCQDRPARQIDHRPVSRDDVRHAICSPTSAVRKVLIA